MDASVFFKKHQPTIQRIAKKHWFDARMSTEDFVQECYADILEKLEKFNPALAGPSTWIWIRVRKTRDRLTRRLNCRPDQSVLTKSIADSHSGGNKFALPGNPDAPAFHMPVQYRTWGCPEVAHQRIRISEVMAIASKSQREAADTLLKGYSAAEVKTALGCGMGARNYRLRKLGLKVAR